MIRYAEITDLKIVYALINLLGSDVYTYDQFGKSFAYNLINNHILLYETNSEVLGLGVLAISCPLHHGGRIAEVTELVVSEKARGKGIGQKLLDKMKKIAVSNNCVGLEVATSNKRLDAHRFYEREGLAITHYKFTKKLILC